MMLGGLGYAEQALEFREQPREGAATPQYFEKGPGYRLGQGLGEFGEYPFRDQSIHLSGLDHGEHQTAGFLGDTEAQGAKPCREAG